MRPCPLYTPPVAPTDWMRWWVNLNDWSYTVKLKVSYIYLQTKLFRGRRSRNKVSVGEPAEGSITSFTSVIFKIEQFDLTFLIFLIIYIYKLTVNLLMTDLWNTELMKSATNCENVVEIVEFGISCITWTLSISVLVTDIQIWLQFFL